MKERDKDEEKERKRTSPLGDGERALENKERGKSEREERRRRVYSRC